MAANITIMPIKALGADGYGYSSHIAQAIYFAVNNGAHIINMSLGGVSSSIIKEACAYADDHGVLLIAAAGNDSSQSLSYPAAYDTVISVGAINDLNQLASYSNYGYGLDLVAPGGDNSRNIKNYKTGIYYPAGILQQTMNAGIIDYWFFQGTSMASAHVTGLAALLKSKNLNLTAAQIKTILINSVDDLGAKGYDVYNGYGVINPVKALEIPGYIVDSEVSSTIVGRIGEIEKWKISTSPCIINVSLDYFASKGALTLNLVNSSGVTVSTGSKVNNAVKLSYPVNATTKGDYYLVVGYEP